MLNTESPQKLTQAIVNAGFTQSKIAEEIGVSQPTVSRILDGRREDSKVSLVKALKKLLAKVKKR